MAQQALGPGTTVPRRRVLFGLLDADGWSWAGLKAGFWLIVIIFMLGYLPDRAYYLTVNRTIDLGILVWSPINLCPPVPNEAMPCPPPVGGVTPWHPSPTEPVSLALPEPRTDGAAVQVGTNILYIGGSDGETAQSTVYVAAAVPVGTFDAWQEGPALPEPRSNASVLSEAGSVFVFGGLDADGNPTDTAFVLTPDPETGDLGEWEPADEALALPEPRADGAIAATATGLVLAGGTGEDGVEQTTWQAAFNDQGTLEPWAGVQPLAQPVTDATLVSTGSYIWLYGGSDADGNPVGGVQRGEFGLPPGPGEEENPDEGLVVAWGTQNESNLPEPRTHAAGWGASGALYLAGGNDGTTSRGEVYWAIPDSNGNIPEWKHLDVSDLPAPGLEGAAPLLTGPNVILIGGESIGPEGSEVLASSVRASLAPQAPFFQLGILGATVPALKIDGEVGQQLGYLNAAAVGTVNFIILLVIGWAYAHQDQTRAFFARFMRRRSRR
jgi:Kelch motif